MEPVAWVQKGKSGLYKQDRRYGRDTTKIEKGKTTYELKDKDVPPHSVIKLCFSSDFFIEEADMWRDGCWDISGGETTALSS